MKRRSFIKLLSGSIISAPFISLASTTSGPKPIVPGSLEDLYQFVESLKLHEWKNCYTTFGHTHPDGTRELWPFQKGILREMWENDKIIFVKGRRIGMSSLLAAFAAWYTQQEPTVVHYRGLNHENGKYWERNIFQPFHPWIPSRAQNPRTLGIFDETNYHYQWHGIMNRGIHLDKVIVAGTPDQAGNLRRLFVDHIRDFHQIWIPCQSCEPLFTKERIAEAKRNLSTKTYKMEIEGNLWYT